MRRRALPWCWRYWRCWHAGRPAPRKSADQALGKAADNAHLRAKRSSMRPLQKHPELVVIGLHAVKPGSKKSTMVAANLDRIGKQDDEDDLAVCVARERKDHSRAESQGPYPVRSGGPPCRMRPEKVIGSLSTGVQVQGRR